MHLTLTFFKERFKERRARLLYVLNKAIYQVPVLASKEIPSLSSYFFKDAKEVLTNTGCFRIAYYNDDVFLKNLEESIKKDTQIKFLFGPALYINRVKLFNLFKKYPDKITLYYREDFDNENHWDEKHFRIIITNEETILALEHRHTEKDPDKVKEACMVFEKGNKKLINEYEKKWEDLIKDLEPKGIVEILKIAKSIRKHHEDTDRYKGAITTIDFQETRSAEDKEIDVVIEELKKDPT